MPFANHQAVIDALKGGYAQLINFYKSVPSTSAGAWYSLWKQAGDYPAGSDPTPALQGAVCDKTTPGALPFINPVAPNRLFIFSWALGGTMGQSLFMYDRLWHAGGVNLNITNTQTFTGVTAPTRHGDGVGNVLLAEITTGAGATSQTLSVSYTNENNVSGRTATIYFPGSIGAGRLLWGNLDAGDCGIKSLQSCVLPGGMGGGVCNLVLVNLKQVFPFGFASYQWLEKEYLLHVAGLPEIAPDSCLAFLFMAGGISAPWFYPRMVMVEG
jgi:hypothetical protein